MQTATTQTEHFFWKCVQAYTRPDGALDPQKDNLATSTLRICRSVPAYYKKEDLLSTLQPQGAATYSKWVLD